MAGTVNSSSKLFNVRELALGIAVRDGTAPAMLGLWESTSAIIHTGRALRNESVFQTKERMKAGKWAFYAAVVEEIYTLDQCADIALKAALEAQV